MARPPAALNPAASPHSLFGSELRRYRERARLSQEQLGARLYVSGSFVGQVERAAKTCRRDLAVAADELLGTGEALAHLWDGLIRTAAFPPWFDWPEHEAEATVLRTFQLAVVYGLLQTEDYMRALLRDEAAVAGRLARQEILTREDPTPPRVVCVLDESVLHREVGDARVMREQLQSLIKVASDQVSVQIVPCRAHEGIMGSFVLGTFDDRSEVAYVELARRGLTTGAPRDIVALTEAFDSIRSKALPVDMSMDLISRTVEERWT